jgi:hypothetical protein
MFCSEVLSFEKSPAMLDYSALALNQERSDAREHLKWGDSGGDPTAVTKSDMIDFRRKAA